MKNTILWVVVAALAFAPWVVPAQTRSAGPARPLIATTHAITRDGARVAVDAIVQEAQRRGVGASIAVVDAGGNVVVVERLEPTFPAGAEVSVGKARTAATFRRPTSFFETTIREGRTPMIALEHFTPLQGGVPIEVGGEVVGAIGISGSSSAAEDEELATLGARAVVAAIGAHR